MYFSTILCLLVIPGGFSSADWSVRHHVGTPTTTTTSTTTITTTTVSAARNSSSVGSITTTGGGDYVCDAAAFESMGFATGCGGGVGLISPRRRRLQNRVLDNRDLCRIVSTFIPETMRSSRRL